MSETEGASPPHTSLLRRVQRETLRYGVIAAIGQGALWASNLLLARLLTKTDFGVYDICGAFVSMAILFGDGGLGAALLRKPVEPTQEEYESVFGFSLIVGVTIAIGFSAAAPLLARAYHLPSGAVWVMVAMAPGYLLGALRTYPMIRLERGLQFSAIARIDLAVLFVRQISAATLALLHFGVYALVFANIGASIFAVVATFVVKRGIPKLRFHKGVLGPLLWFGLKVQALIIVAFFKDNVSALLLGALAGPAAVGVFDFGMRFIQLPVLAVNALAKIQLPTYGRLQNDKAALYRAVRGAMRLMFLAGVPALVVLAVASPWLVPTLYGAQWVESLPVIWALVINMVGGLAASPLFTLMQARNQAGTALTTFAIWTATTWALCIGAYAFGLSITGIAAAHSIVTFGITIVLIRRAGVALERSLFPAIAAPVAAGAVAVGAHFGLRALGATNAIAMHPAGLLAIPLVVYVATELALEGKHVFAEIRELVHAARTPEPAPEAAA